MSQIATVQSKKFSKSGSPMFGLDGQTYFVSRNTSVQGLEPGVKIEFEWEEFGDDRGRGRPRTITRWKSADSYNQGTPQSSGIAGNASQNRSNGASQVSAPPSDALYMPFISNTIAHAIQAGLIKQPMDLAPWVLGAKAALSAKPQTKGPAGSDEEFDDEIPF